PTAWSASRHSVVQSCTMKYSRTTVCSLPCASRVKSRGLSNNYWLWPQSPSPKRRVLIMARKSVKKDPAKLRSRQWFANPANPNMTALYLERYMNFGLKREELQAGKPIIGIAQSGSDLSPCNRHHLELAHRVREGIREAGGIAFEFPVHPIQETGKRPTAALDRNLCYL